MTNPTAVKFGHPATLVAETPFWMVLARPQQPTFGSVVLICKERIGALPQASPQAFADLKQVTAKVEAMLKALVDYEKINYLMLMMVDPDVHFHVLPRYGQAREHDGLRFEDAGWPGVPALGATVDLGVEGAARLAQQMKSAWPA